MHKLIERMEDVSLKAMMGIDVDAMEVSNLLTEAEVAGIETEDFENLIFGDNGKAVNVEDLIARVECAGYRVAVEENEEDIDLVLSEVATGVILH